MAEYLNKTKFEELMRKKARSNFDLYYADRSNRYHDNAIAYNIAADEAHVFPSADVQPVYQWQKLTAENEKLKRILKNAMSDIYKKCSCGNFDCDICERETCDYDDRFTWRLEKEAFDLIYKRGEQK